MADPLVAPDVVRYTVNQLFQGREVANVIDMVLTQDGGTLFTRAEQVNNVAGDVLDAWDQYVLGAQSNQLSAVSVSWVDLDSLTGSTGSINETEDTTWPAPGRAEGPALPSNTSILVTKETVSTRGSRTGRMYVAGITEQFTTGNTIDSGFLGTLVTDFGDFTEALTETGIIEGNNNFPTVVHTRTQDTMLGPVVTYLGNTQVTSFAPQAVLATQRRRLRA